MERFFLHDNVTFLSKENLHYYYYFLKSVTFTVKEMNTFYGCSEQE